MTVRIEQLTKGNTLELQIEGDLVGEAVEVLRQELRGLAAVEGVTLDVSGVRFADREGADLLSDAARAGRALTGLSPYLRLLLSSHPETASTEGDDADSRMGALAGDRESEGRSP